MATDWAAEAAKFGGASASAPAKAPSIDWASEAAKFGGSSAAPAAPPPTPTYAQYHEPEGLIHATLRKTAEKMNIGNILDTVAEAGRLAENGKVIPNSPTFDLKTGKMSHDDEDTTGSVLKSLIPNPIEWAKDTYQKLADHDYSGAASNIIPLLFAKGGPEAAEAVSTKAAALTDAAKTQAGALAKAGIAVAPSLPYGIGKTVTAVQKFTDVYSKAVAAKKALDYESDAAPYRDLANQHNQDLKADTQIPTEARIDPKISVDAASSAMGTKPNIELATNAGKGYRVADILDAETQTRLAKAAQTGKASALPPASRVQLVNAVKAGDAATVNSLLDKVGAATEQGAKVDKSVTDKVAILVKFAQDHNIDLDAVDPSQRQALADGAIAYAKLNGHGTLPTRGKYVGISDTTLQYVKDALKKMQQ